MSPALTGIIPEVLKPHQLQSGNALLALGANTARIAGLVFAGGIVALVGGAALLSPEVRRLRAPEYEPVPVMVTAAD